MHAIVDFIIYFLPCFSKYIYFWLTQEWRKFDRSLFFINYPDTFNMKQKLKESHYAK